MLRTEQRQGVRMLKLRDVLSRWEAGSLSQLEAAEIVGMSERSVRRWTRRFEEEGEDGLLDRRLGRRSGRAVPEDEADEVGRLYRQRYAGFTAKHSTSTWCGTMAFAGATVGPRPICRAEAIWPGRRGAARTAARAPAGR